MSFRIGEGNRVYVEGSSNTATAFQLDGRVELAGSFDHNPVPGGGSTYIKHMVVNPTGPLPSSSSSPSEPAPARPDHRVVGFNRAAGRTCSCGFAGFAWQKECPRCGASLTET